MNLSKKIFISLIVLTINLCAGVEEFEKYITKEIADKTPPSASFAILKGDKIALDDSIKKYFPNFNLRYNGWYHIHDKGKFFYQHQGLGTGFRTIMRIYPKYDISIIILTSQTSIDIDGWADRLIENIINTEDLSEKKPI